MIPNFNGAELLPACLDAIGAQTFEPNQVVVVDNASTDGSVALLAESYPSVTLLPLDSNTGFAHAVNAGIKITDSPLVAVLNSDAVAEPGWLKYLVETISGDQSIGGCSPKLLLGSPPADDAPPVIEAAGEWLSIWGTVDKRGNGEGDRGQYATPARPTFVSGTASILRREMFDQMGGFDDDLFAYFEDVDLCIRARLAGWEFAFDPRSVVWHRCGATSGGSRSRRTRYLITRNGLAVWIKDMPASIALRYLPFVVVAQAARLVESLFIGVAGASAKGVVDGIRLGAAARSRQGRGGAADSKLVVALRRGLVHRLPQARKLSSWVSRRLGRSAAPSH